MISLKFNDVNIWPLKPDLHASPAGERRGGFEISLAGFL